MQLAGIKEMPHPVVHRLQYTVRLMPPTIRLDYGALLPVSFRPAFLSSISMLLASGILFGVRISDLSSYAFLTGALLDLLR